MRKIIIIICLLFFVVGCKMDFPPLEKDAISFTLDNYKDNSGKEYVSINYDGVTYIPFGTLRGSLKDIELNKCIGYIVQNSSSSSTVDKENKENRVYTLMNDEDNYYLMEYYVISDSSSQPKFYRRIDSRYKDINIPSYIEKTNRDFWN